MLLSLNVKGLKARGVDLNGIKFSLKKQNNLTVGELCHRVNTVGHTDIWEEADK